MPHDDDGRDDAGDVCSERRWHTPGPQFPYIIDEAHRGWNPYRSKLQVYAHGSKC